MAERLDARLVRAQAMQTLSACLSQTGRSTESIVVMERAFALAKEVGDFSNLTRAYVNMSSQLADQGFDQRRAEVILREGLELAERAGARPPTAWMTLNLGDVLMRLGRLDEAEATLRTARELAAEVGDEPLIGMTQARIAAVVLFRGRVDEAEAAQAEAVPILEANPEPQSHLFIPWTSGLIALVRGENGSAAELLARTAGELRGSSLANASEVFPDAVRAHLRAARDREAAGFRDLSEREATPTTQANATLVEGLLAEDPAESRRLIADAVAALEELGLRVDAARATVDLGLAMRRLGEDPGPTLEHAREVLLECNAVGFLFEVDQALAAT
jgi:ATP/maltotriose-dependent transcriptional regulator MalT